MKQRLTSLEAERQSTLAVSKPVEKALDAKYGPGASVITKSGKLTIGYMIQAWYYSIQNDSRGFFHDPNLNGIIDNNLAQDVNSFRIRRTEIRLTMDFNENISGVIMFDPAREAAGFPSFPSNQGLIKRSPVADGGSATNVAFTGGIGGGLPGTVGAPPRLLQDAYINYHGYIPHHDFQIGQYKPWVGEEGPRSTSELDFAERSILGLFADPRDLGVTVHGSWWGKDSNDRDGRFQYWLAVFDGATSYWNNGTAQNRSDNNQSKDLNARLLVRPVWDDCGGKLEIGGSYQGGVHGLIEDPSLYPAVTATSPIPPQVWASRFNAWGSYKFGDWFAKGLWVRGEWGWIKDRNEGSVVAFGNGNLGTGAAAGLSQTALRAFSTQGFYAAAGYRFGESSWVECTPNWLKPFEVLGRYEQFQNIESANISDPTRTDVFNTRVVTAGLNYYFKGNTKIQANYNFVDLPADKSNASRSFHDTRNNSFVVNFQLAF